MDALYEHATQALAQFDAVARTLCASERETRLIADAHRGGPVQQARFCDLLVLGQNDPGYATTDVLETCRSA